MLDDARSSVADADRRRAVRGRLHERRHRVRQLRAARRRRGARADRPPAPHRQQHRARGRAQHAEGARPPRLAHDAAAGRRHRHRRRPTRCARRITRRHGARLGDAREQRDRHDSADRRARARSRTSTARCSTPTPCSRSARFRSTCARSASICCRCRRTSSTARRAPARCGSSAARGWSAIHDRRQARAQPPRRHRERARRSPAWASPRGWRAAEAGDRGARASPRCAIGSRQAILGARARAPPSTARATPRVPNTTNISFDGVEAESLLIALDLEGIAVSTGSACSSGTLEPSHVLRAMGLPAHRTQNSIRFSLGAGNTDAEVDSRRREAAAARREAAQPDATAGRLGHGARGSR